MQPARPAGQPPLDAKKSSYKQIGKYIKLQVSDTAVETTAGGLTTGWWAAMWECFSSHPVWYLCCVGVLLFTSFGIYMYKHAVACPLQEILSLGGFRARI